MRLYSLLTACIAELFGTALLLGGVMAAFDEHNVGLKNNLGFLLVGGVVLAIGLSLGGPSGYTINPARDLGSHLFGALAGMTGLFAGGYWIVAPILMPLIGALIGIVLYDAFIAPGIEFKHLVAVLKRFALTYLRTQPRPRFLLPVVIACHPIRKKRK